MIVTTNPYTQKKIAEYAFLNNEELEDKLTNVQNSYCTWQKTSFDEREKLGQQLKTVLQNKKEEFAKLITLEMGKPLRESLSEIEKCLELIDYFSINAKTLLSNTHLNDNAYITYQPTGAVLGIMPWNFPFWQVFRYAFPNIMGGNVCLLKHAPNVTGCGLAIAQLFIDAGYPYFICTTLLIDIPQVEQVIAHQIVQGVCVTGSTKAGGAVGLLAGKHLKKSVLELGGIDAAILLKDADFETALKETFKARVFNAGQVCIAPKRIFIPEQGLEKSIVFLTQQIKKLTLGNPLENYVNMGPIAKSEFLNRLKNQVDGLVKDNAKLIVGGKIKFPFFEPTLLVVNPNNAMLKEEIFGPVICFIPYKNERDLIGLVNDNDYGLGASIWSQNIEKAKQIATKIDVGFVSINQKVSSDVKLPFGGIKKSGYGKELGVVGIKTFLNAKTVTVA